MEFNVVDDIKFLREMLNLSQADLANDLNMPKLSIVRIENGENFPNNETLEKIYSYAYSNGIKLNLIKEMLYKEDNPNLKILFHASKEGLKEPISLTYGRENNDFGKGFYCGESSEQMSSFVSRYPNSCLYMFSFNEANLKKVEFDVNQEWMLAIAYFRGRLDEYSNCKIIQNIIKKVSNVDYVIAPIADNRMYMIINQFIDGYITDEQCKHCLAATNLGKQYVLLSDKAISKLNMLEKCYISIPEKKKLNLRKTEDSVDGENKVKLAMVKYKNQGRYIGEILDEKNR